MQIYLAGNLMGHDMIRDFAESPWYMDVLFSYFYIIDEGMAADNYAITKIRKGVKHECWYYHPESESYFIGDSDDKKTAMHCVNLGPAIDKTEHELKLTLRRNKANGNHFKK